MAFEYVMLVIMALFFLVAWLPSSLAKLQTYGAKWAASSRETTPDRPLPAWGGRAERAHQNLKDNFPAFIVAILLLGTVTKFDHTTCWAAGIYVAARLGHMIVYIAGWKRPRFMFYCIGLISNIFLLVKVLV